MPKMVHFGEFFWKLEALGQTVLPDRSLLVGQILVENAKIKQDWNLQSIARDNGQIGSLTNIWIIAKYWKIEQNDENVTVI